MPQANIYQSDFSGPQIDERLTMVGSLPSALDALEKAIAAKYTLPEGGIPSREMDVAVQDALAKAMTAVQSLADYYTKQEVNSIASAIAGYSAVTAATLPAASAETLGKVYYIGPTEGEYTRYVSSQNGSSFSWINLGTTELALDQYVTRDEFDATAVKYTGLEDVPIGANILQPSMILSTSRYLRRQDGVTTQSGGYGYTDYIPIPPEGLVCNSVFTTAGTYGCRMCYYDEDKNYVGYNGANSVCLPAVGRAFVRFNLGPAPETGGYAVFKGTRNPGYSAPVTPSSVVDGSVIADRSIPLEKMRDISSVNLIPGTTAGRYYNSSTGQYQSNSEYEATDRIRIKPDTDYALRVKAYTIALFDEDGILTRELSDANTFHTTALEVMCVVTVYATTARQYMMVEGAIAPAAYMPYKLQFNEDVIPYKEIPDGSITQSKFAPGISLPAAPAKFDAFRFAGTVAPGSSITGAGILISTRQQLTAEILGTIEEVLVGVGNNNTYGAWLKITPTQVQVIYGSSGTVESTANHGLTLGTRTKVVISMGTSAVFKITDDYGHYYTGTMRRFVGTPFVRNNGSANLDASGAYVSKIATSRVWVVGDSYWSVGDPNRIPSQLSNLGGASYLLVARGGASATDVLPSITQLLGSGALPSYIVWAIGMNNGSDSGGAVNTTWLARVTTFLEMCANAGITPVFVTVPTVPGYPHDALNTWIRESGYRYIDAAAEVEQFGTNTWRGWGTSDALLSSDQVHPTAAGALQLAARVLVDFPEIAQM